MKKRVISGAVGIVLLVFILTLYNTPVLTAALALLSGIAVYEVLIPTHYMTSKAGGVLCALFAGVSIFVVESHKEVYLFTLVLFLAVLIASALLSHRRFSFQQICVCAFIVVAIPLSFSTVLQMKEMIYLILVCVAAWVTDMGAYFVGRAFGKRKMAHNISPNKTVEGAIGGLISAGVLFPLTCYIYCRVASVSMDFSIVNAIIIGLLCAFFGMMGDLFASLIKRETGIKDFGKIMPGHGGIMDRFDSFLFVAPTLFYLVKILPIFIY